VFAGFFLVFMFCNPIYTYSLKQGIDAPTCKNVVLARVVNSMTEFKQIIGRGTRLREDYGKLWFSIIDYTGSATKNFADPEFDGYPEVENEVVIDAEGQEQQAEADVSTAEPEADDAWNEAEPGESTADPDEGEELRDKWADPVQREEIMIELEERGIDFNQLAEEAGKPEADPLDLLCHLAFEAPLRTRMERAEYLRKNTPDFFDQCGPEATEILESLLEKYTDYGPKQFVIPDALQVAPISDHGNVIEIASLFGGAVRMKTAVDTMQALLYKM